MNDVPLREYIEALINELHRDQNVAEGEREKAAKALREQLATQIEQGDQALERHITDQVASIRAALKSADQLRASDQKAIDKAFESATKLSEAHNDLLHKMEKLTESFATKEAMVDRFDTIESQSDQRFKHVEGWQARLSGGMILLGAIGIANLVKLWGG